MKGNKAKTLKWTLGLIFALAVGLYGLTFLFGDINWTPEKRIDVATLEANNPEQRKAKEKLLALQEEKGRSLKEEEILSVLPEKLVRYGQFATGLNRQLINFHGRVVDQHSNPVKRAQVFASLGASGLSGGSRTYRWTDDEGYFSFEDVEGYRLLLYSIKHAEVQQMKKARYDRASGYTQISYGYPSFHGFQPNAGADELLWTDYNTKDKAYEFQVWRYEGGAEVKKRRFGVSCRNGQSPYYFNILETRRGIAQEEWDDGKAHLKISCHVDQIKPGGNEYSRKPRHWWVEIEALEGAFQEIGLDDLYMNEAPASGYNQTLYRVERVPGTDGYTSNHTIRFYYKSDIYASLHFDIKGLMPKSLKESNPVSIGVDGKINMDGGRLLEIRE